MCDCVGSGVGKLVGVAVGERVGDGVGSGVGTTVGRGEAIAVSPTANCFKSDEQLARIELSQITELNEVTTFPRP